jgi:hypothetical protein
MANRLGRLFFVFLFLSSALAWTQEQTVKQLVAGERFEVKEGIYGVCEFSQKPQIGMVILKIRLFDKNDVKISTLVISGESGMPSMPGHHDSGDVAFKLNKAQNYLLPVNVVMPGDWEVKLKFRDGEQIVLLAAVRFDV